MANLPLEDIRVLDASNTYAGPTCGRVLADLGAEVIHVEAMQRWELVRLIILAENDAGERYWNRGGYFMARNLGKKDTTLDLTRPAGVELFKQVATTCDVVLESFAPRVMRLFGLAYEDLRAVRPDIIYCSLSGYGQEGPYRDWVAYGMGLEPASGISQTTGYPGGPPLRSGISLTDPLSGLAAAAAVLIALHYRRRTGKGQYIDLSEHEAAIPLVGDALLDYQMNARLPERRGNRSWFAAPQGCYPCKKDEGGRMKAGEGTDRPTSSYIPHPPSFDDDWVVISCHNDAEFERLCAATGHPEWQEDERFADVLARHDNHDALDALIADWTRGRTRMEATAALQAAGVRAAPILHSKDLLLNEHLRARGHFDVVDHPEIGPRPYPRQLPVHFSKFAARARGHAPLLGEHNDEVLQGIAGLSDDELAALRAQQIVGERPEPLPPVEFVKGVAEQPMDVLLAIGAVKAVEPDYREQLGLRGTKPQMDADKGG